MSASEFKRVIAEHVRAVLAPVGFRKKGQTYVREIGDVVQSINLQSSQTSTTSVLIMTVNLGVRIPMLDEPWEQADLGRTHWNQRLGNLAGQDDRWWTITSAAEADAAGQELAALLTTMGVPALDYLRSSDALRRLWEAGTCPGLTEIQRRRYLDKLRDSIRSS